MSGQIDESSGVSPVEPSSEQSFVEGSQAPASPRSADSGLFPIFDFPQSTQGDMPMSFEFPPSDLPPDPDPALVEDRAVFLQQSLEDGTPNPFYIEDDGSPERPGENLEQYARVDLMRFQKNLPSTDILEDPSLAAEQAVKSDWESYVNGVLFSLDLQPTVMVRLLGVFQQVPRTLGMIRPRDVGAWHQLDFTAAKKRAFELLNDDQRKLLKKKAEIEMRIEFEKEFLRRTRDILTAELDWKELILRQAQVKAELELVDEHGRSLSERREKLLRKIKEDKEAEDSSEPNPEKPSQASLKNELIKLERELRIGRRRHRRLEELSQSLNAILFSGLTLETADEDLKRLWQQLERIALDILDLEEIIETTKAAVGDENTPDLSACESRVLELKATYEGTIAALQASALKASAYEKGLECDEEVASHFAKKYREIEESKRREVDMLRDSYERRIKELEETHETERLNFEIQKSALRELADDLVEPGEAGDLMTEISEAKEQEAKTEKRRENLEQVQRRLGKLQREIDLTEKMMGERRKFYEAKEAHDQEIRQLADEKASLEAQNAMLAVRVDELETAQTLDEASSDGITNSWVKEKFQYSDSRYVWYTQRRILDTHLNRLENEKAKSDAELAKLKEENTRLQEVVKVLEKKEKELAVVDSVNIIETGMKKRAKTFKKLMQDEEAGGDSSAPEADVDAETVELYTYRKVIENSMISLDESVADLVNLMLTIRSNMQDQAGQEATEGQATDPIHEAMLAADPVFRMVEDRALDISARIRLVQDEAESFWKGKATPPTSLQLVRAVKAKDVQIGKLEAKYMTSELPSPFRSL